MTKTVTVNGKTYHLSPMKFGEGRTIFAPGSDPFEANCQMVAACLNHGNGPSAGSSQPLNGKNSFTVDDIQNMDYPDGQALVLQALELNGLRKATTGEEEAVAARSLTTA